MSLNVTIFERAPGIWRIRIETGHGERRFLTETLHGDRAAAEARRRTIVQEFAFGTPVYKIISSKLYKKKRRKAREKSFVLWRYGITVADRERMMKDQAMRCVGCGTSLHKATPHVDHCHTTGRVRGVLCRGCNHALGNVLDNPETLRRLAEYLERSRHESAAA